MFVTQSYSIRDHNNSYDYENHNKYRQNQTLSRKVGEEKVDLNNKLFSENWIYNPMNVFSKPMETSNIRELR